MEQKMKLKTALLMTFVMCLLLCLYSLVLGRLAIAEGWAGFLFFWYWSTIKQFDLPCLKQDIPNTLVGIAAAFGMQLAVYNLSITLFWVILFVVLFVIIGLSVTNLVPMAVGPTTFLYFTVLTGNLMLVQANYIQVFISYIVGVLFFVLVLGTALKLITQKKK